MFRSEKEIDLAMSVCQSVLEPIWINFLFLKGSGVQIIRNDLGKH